MLNFSNHESKVKYLLIILALILVLLVGMTIYRVDLEEKKENLSQNKFVDSDPEIKAEPMAQEQIDEAFKKAEEDASPLSEGQIDKAFEKAE